MAFLFRLHIQDGSWPLLARFFAIFITKFATTTMHYENDDDGPAIDPALQPYVAEALDVVKLRFGECDNLCAA